MCVRGEKKCQRDERDGIKKKRVIIPSGRLMRIPLAIILDFPSVSQTVSSPRFIFFCLKNGEGNKRDFESNLAFRFYWKFLVRIITSDESRWRKINICPRDFVVIKPLFDSKCSQKFCTSIHAHQQQKKNEPFFFYPRYCEKTKSRQSGFESTAPTRVYIHPSSKSTIAYKV